MSCVPKRILLRHLFGGEGGHWKDAGAEESLANAGMGASVHRHSSSHGRCTGGPTATVGTIARGAPVGTVNLLNVYNMYRADYECRNEPMDNTAWYASGRSTSS